MAENIPICRNAARFKDHTSDMRLKGEVSDAWIFQCRGCELTQVVSKEGVRDKSKFEQAARQIAQETERLRRLDARPKIFT